MLYKISHLLKVLSSKRDARREITISSRIEIDRHRSQSHISFSIPTMLIFNTNMRYACSGNVSLSLSISRTRSLREGSKKRPPRFCGRKVADAGLRQTDQEESRLTTPAASLKGGRSHGALASFRSSATARAATPDGSLRTGFCTYVEITNAFENFHQSFCDKMTNSTLKLTQDKAKEEFN